MILGNNYSLPFDDPFVEFLESVREEKKLEKFIPSEFLYDLKRGLGLVGRELLPKYRHCFTNEVRGTVFQTWHIEYDISEHPSIRLQIHRNRFLAAPLMNGKPVRAHSIGIGINERTA